MARALPEPAVLGLAGGVILMAAVLAVEVVHAQRSVPSQLADCQTSALSDRTDYVCDTAVQVGGVEVAVAIAIGFSGAFAWFLRRQRLSE